MTSKKRIVEKIVNSKLNDKIKNSIKNRIRILRDKGCWTVNEDWSMYAGKLHRHMYEAFVGPLISGRMICHKCDRPGCVNPDHLFQGTNKDNMSDAIKKGRRFIGSGRSNLKKLRERDRISRLVRFTGQR